MAISAEANRDEDLSDDGAELIERLQKQGDAHCSSCGFILCAHQVLVSIALGLGSAPRCLRCTARGMEQSPEQLAERMFGYFQSRGCYWAAWKWAGEKEGVDPAGIPSCMAFHAT